jgi:hypothetical protein
MSKKGKSGDVETGIQYKKHRTLKQKFETSLSPLHQTQSDKGKSSDSEPGSGAGSTDPATKQPCVGHPREDSELLFELRKRYLHMHLLAQ